ncbi:MAG: hypothetical protein FJY53_07605, partial [Betaproteobacteria bacterium]|nr:hypothetical protein [Betaproteobacteria bacterium]
MINCLLIKISQNSRGLPVRSYRNIHAEELTFGRGAECTVHLHDPRIAMHHAVIRRTDEGQIHIVTINGELEVELSLHQSVALTQGVHVMMGPYQLSVEPTPPDVDLVISLTLAQPLPDDYENIKSRTHDPLPNASAFKRRFSIGMATFIILFFIGLPLAQNLIPQWREAIAEWPYGFDRVWSPGRMSTAHRHFGSQCVNCHQTPLQKVTDKPCVTCHQTTVTHLADADLQKRALKATHRFIGSMRCAECHQEHKSPHPLARQDNQMCAKCHGNIQKINPDTTLKDVTDFDSNHPNFRLTFKTGPKDTDVQRIAQDEKAKLVEHSGLIFPHDQHIGLVRGPNGMMDLRELSCTTCHQPDGKQARFSAISYQRDCQLCHAAELTLGAGKEKFSVPHGNEQNVWNALKLGDKKDFDRHSETLKTAGCAYCHEVIE